MRRLALVLGALGFLAVPSSAAAWGPHWLRRHVTPGAQWRHTRPISVGFHDRQPALALAQAAAVEYWGVPCGGDVSVTYASESSAPAYVSSVPLPHVWALTWFDTPIGPIAFNAPPVEYRDCQVMINSDIWTPHTEASDFSDFCGLMVHEYGHLLGHADMLGTPPTSITYPIISQANEHVGPCVERYRAYEGT